VCNPGAVDTRTIAEQLGLTQPWLTREGFESLVVAPRSFCVLNTDKLSAVRPLPPVEEALAACIAQRRT
jgi:hypothetical protein